MPNIYDFPQITQAEWDIPVNSLFLRKETSVKSLFRTGVLNLRGEVGVDFQGMVSALEENKKLRNKTNHTGTQNYKSNTIICLL